MAAEILIRYAAAQALSKGGTPIPLQYVTFSAMCSSPNSAFQIKTLSDDVYYDAYYEKNPKEFKAKQQEWKAVFDKNGGGFMAAIAANNEVGARFAPKK